MSAFPSQQINHPPHANELEMSVFGPGVGECIVLHLGDGDWIVVDSCTSPPGTEPIALHYLYGLGIDATKHVRKIIATHWHDDHIRGLAKLVRECEQAEFVMSAALAREQFFQLILEVDARNRLVRHTSSASELADILETLQKRRPSKFVTGPSIYAQDGTRLFHGGFGKALEVWALSPSSATITNATTEFLADALLTKGDCRRFKSFSPNDLSVALLVRSNSHSLLLGADLENTKSDEFGWKAVLRSANRPASMSNAFKIAHHGSENGHHANVWTTMLVPDCTAVITPFASVPLPNDTDIERIKGCTRNAYCTTWPILRKPPRRKGVDGIVGGATKSRRSLNPECGFVRLRVDLADATAIPTIELFGSARRF